MGGCGVQKVGKGEQLRQVMLATAFLYLKIDL